MTTVKAGQEGTGGSAEAWGVASPRLGVEKRRVGGLPTPLSAPATIAL